MIAFAVLALLAPQDELVVRTWKKHVLSEEFKCEGATAGDFNKDGKTDVAAGPWWYEGPDFTKRHEFYPVLSWKKDNDYSNNFFAFPYDFNKDGWTDVLVYGFPGKDASWFENPQGKGGGHWKKHEIWGNVDNESPTFTDVNGDGVPDIACCSGGHIGYVTIADGKFHPVTPKGKY
ncbi:MAG: FG-GAP repeat domain-containing protein, partial [Vicinamibacteria bacterium]